jgi:membrane-bound serine protease (ClpP class)
MNGRLPRTRGLSWSGLPGSPAARRGLHLAGLLATAAALPGGRTVAEDDPFAGDRKAQGEPRLLLVHAQGSIDASLVERVRADVKKRIEELSDIRFVVFEIDSEGADFPAAREFAEFIAADLKSLQTIAFIPPGKQATGNAVLPALACHHLVMGPRSVLGAVDPTRAGPESTDLKAALRKNARKPPSILVEALTSGDHEDIFRVHFAQPAGNAEREESQFLTRGDIEQLRPERRIQRRGQDELVLARGKLLRVSEVEARDLGIIQHIASSLPDVLERLRILIGQENIIDAAGGVLKSRYPRGQAVVEFLNQPLPRFVLLLCGSLAIFLELKMLGSLIPGLVGLVFFAVFFISSLMPSGGNPEGTATLFEALLFVIGLGLLSIEFFLLPGLAVFALTGAALCAVSIVMAMVPGTPSAASLTFEGAVSILAFGFGAGAVACLFLARYLPSNPILARKGLVSHGAIVGVPTADSALQAQAEALSLLGKSGKAVTSLRPAGKVELADGRLLDVVAEGEFVEPGTAVKVILADGGRIVVERTR